MWRALHARGDGVPASTARCSDRWRVWVSAGALCLGRGAVGRVGARSDNGGSAPVSPLDVVATEIIRIEAVAAAGCW